MIFIISPNEFEKFDNETSNQINDYYKTNKNIIRPIFNNNNDEEDEYLDDKFIIKQFLKPITNDNELKQVYKKNKKLKSIKCLDEKTYNLFFV